MSIINKKDLKSDKGYYFPLYNDMGLMSYVTPRLSGDVKLDYHHYITEPLTEKDLSNSTFSRNVIFYVDGKLYHLNGHGYNQHQDKLDLEVGLLYQVVTRKNNKCHIQTTSFNPNQTTIELHEIKYTNVSDKAQKLKVLTATPLYGRSADNLRDHRHVTSLLNRVFVKTGAIILNPTLSFDERGHKPNDTYYGFFAASNDLNVKAYRPILDDFVGEGTLLYPKPTKTYRVGDQIDGYETMGGIEFDTLTIQPNDSVTLYIGLGAANDEATLLSFQSLLNPKAFNEALSVSKAYWANEVHKIGFKIENEAISNYLGFVQLQPILRRFFGNSYMPHHDYGKGGKGWRDLWQDLLALIMYQDDTVKETLINNFAGIRVDGTNATIIGKQLGEFKADRNNIVRVWSDHGAWPLLTTLMYIHETGDIDFLFEKMPYFDDQFTHYTKRVKKVIAKDNRVSIDGKQYLGTIYEHLLLENVVAVLNTGKNGFIKLEDADWNDGLDMAHDLGETLAFTHFYANNLKLMADILAESKQDNIELFEALGDLTLNLNQKTVSLDAYFDRVSTFNEPVRTYQSKAIIQALNKKYQHMIDHLKKHGMHASGAVQSYIDNDGAFLDQDSLALTGQAMALLSQTVSKKQANRIAIETKKALFDKSIGGYKLNTDYNEVKLNMGRAFGFAYGHKENGAVFSHMAIMYGYGLYQYGLVQKGRDTLFAIINRAMKEDSHVLAGIPEYFTPRGVGKYAYLTGSASWLLKALRQEVFGIQMHIGKVTFEPKLDQADFMNGVASIETYLFGKKRVITYLNPKKLAYGKYAIKWIKENGVLTEKRTFDTLSGNVEVMLDDTL